MTNIFFIITIFITIIIIITVTIIIIKTIISIFHYCYYYYLKYIAPKGWPTKVSA